ncbi:RNA polymerase sigma factor [Streptomonospora salina]|uniref:RNA polymerase sigma factor (Sigma-70 family) n=1 Tax=Streptomonospora salina TaxID=104205 RepID=A0A841EM08_9ACTN|nr:sigma-70 family RNA polymerase sigma factor [Streptomonospora salina]MBB6000451.1 RNA polymerase sigma factor (sigma-70 family) [Streptomonospora salina]
MADQSYAEASTGELVKRALSDDETAWEALIDRFAVRVHAVVRSYGLSPHDAQDAEQTVWSNLAEHLSRLRTPDRVGPWLATATQRECGRIRRLARRAPPAEPEWLHAVDRRSPEEITVAAERDSLVRRAIAALAEPDRTVAVLELHAPRSPAPDVAEFAGLRQAEVPAVRRRVRRRLQRLLTEQGYGAGAPRGDGGAEEGSARTDPGDGRERDRARPAGPGRR